jgi:alcohol dehydrogenase
MRMTGNRGVDTAIEAAGLPATLVELCQGMIAPGGTIANIYVHGNNADIQLELHWDRAVFAPQAVQHNPDLLFS